MSSTEAYLRLAPDRATPEGVVPTGFGNVVTTRDMKEFASLCRPKHPYLDFIVRKRAAGVEPLDLDRLLEGTIVSREGAETKLEMELRDYQEEGIRHVVERLDGKAILAPDPGMGKTLMAILLYKRYGGKGLFVVPSGIAIQWVRELGRIAGIKAQHFAKRRDAITSDVVVTSFGMVRDCLSTFLAESWNYVCVDESEAIKRESQQGEAVCRVVAASHARILMSGTPQTCSPVDLFNQLYCLFPEVFRDRKLFAERYTKGTYDNFGKWIVEHTVHSMADELHLMLDTVMYRITEERQEDLPMKHRHIVPMVCCGKNRADLDLLQREQRECVSKIREVKGDARRERELTMELRTICNAIRHTAGRIKAKICTNWVRDFIAAQAAHEKYVFFVEHVDTITNLSAVLDSLGHEFAVIFGPVSQDKRDEYVQQIADPTHPLRFLIASYKTCAQGITLCPGARFIFFVELAFTPTLMQQAEKRVNRQTAVEEAMLYWFKLEGSTDNKILRTLQERFRDNAHIVDGRLEQKFIFETLPTFHESEEGDIASGLTELRDKGAARRIFQSEADEAQGRGLMECFEAGQAKRRRRAQSFVADE